MRRARYFSAQNGATGATRGAVHRHDRGRRPRFPNLPRARRRMRSSCSVPIRSRSSCCSTPQASLPEGDHEAARSKFEAMLKDPGSLKLPRPARALYLEGAPAGRKNESRVPLFARPGRHAGAAAVLGADATLEQMSEAARLGWRHPARRKKARRQHRQIRTRAAFAPQGVLLTAKAIENLQADPTTAKNRRALRGPNRMAPDLGLPARP